MVGAGVEDDAAGVAAAGFAKKLGMDVDDVVVAAADEPVAGAPKENDPGAGAEGFGCSVEAVEAPDDGNGTVDGFAGRVDLGA